MAKGIENLAHHISGRGCTAIALNFESFLVVMEGCSSERLQLQRTLRNNNLLVNVRLKVRTAQFYSVLLKDLLCALDQITEV